MFQRRPGFTHFNAHFNASRGTHRTALSSSLPDPPFFCCIYPYLHDTLGLIGVCAENATFDRASLRLECICVTNSDQRWRNFCWLNPEFDVLGRQSDLVL